MARLPDFIIVGAQKSGTTAAARNLSLHPLIDVYSGTNEYGQKELEFFNQHWDRGVTWYTSHFDEGPGIVGEKTAELLHRTVCHQRMHLVNVNFKIVVLLRSPVERAYSQWRMAALAKRDEPDSFDTVIVRELAVLDDDSYRQHFYSCNETTVSCWREGYVLKGFYAEQLESLYRWFPRKNVLVCVSERIRSDLSLGYRDMFRFLGLEPPNATFGEHFVGRPCLPMSARVRATLSEVYREPNRRLFSMIGTEVPEWR